LNNDINETVKAEIYVISTKKKGLALMRSVTFTIIIALLQIVFISIFVAAVIKLQVSTSVKILIISGIIVAILLLKSIEEGIFQVCKNQGKILYFLRTTFISVEMARLEPENQKPSIDILTEDMKIEKTYEEMRNEVFSGLWSIPIYLLWTVYAGLYVFGIIIITIFFLNNWELLSSLLS